ncbi:MAG: toll/interleukin-1 receptor domain-containing protein [Actinomycetota bacterium]
MAPTASMGTAGMSKRMNARGFLSHAHEDRRLVERFRRLLDDRLAIDRSLDFSIWWDADILVGELWDNRIREAMATADFGLLAISPAFLASPYIATVEIPTIVNDPAMLVIPVGLQSVDFARSDLHGLEAHQIFRFRTPGASPPRFFADLSGQNPARFCDRLAGQISARCLGHRTRP